MTKCSIIILDTSPLKTLAYADRLDLLLSPKFPVFVTYMVIAELKAGSQYLGNRRALDFINFHIDSGDGLVIKIPTGVPDQIEDLKALRVDPGEHSIKLALEDYYSANPDDYALLLFED